MFVKVSSTTWVNINGVEMVDQTPDDRSIIYLASGHELVLYSDGEKLSPVWDLEDLTAAHWEQPAALLAPKFIEASSGRHLCISLIDAITQPSPESSTAICHLRSRQQHEVELKWRGIYGKGMTLDEYVQCIHNEIAEHYEQAQDLKSDSVSMGM